MSSGRTAGAAELSSSDRDPRGLLLGAVVATGIGVLSADTMPLLMGALMDDLGPSEARAGPLGSVELAAGALVSISVAHWVGRISRRTLALAGAALVLWRSGRWWRGSCSTEGHTVS